ncbi:MAG TPA: xanthine dehydrogenase accessory protein XdhC [Bauldia sp.]|nr:xanthine dehydrogenase accessory protein XdhC [Bauldia sp.]
MTNTWRQVLDGIDRHGRLAMVTIAAKRGSSPRDAGARMLVYPDATFTGTIGGGTLEWKAIAMAQAALANPNAPKAETRGFALGPELGQCCGGNVELVLELIERNRRDEIATLAEREASGNITTRGRLVSDQGVVREIVDPTLTPGAAAYTAGVLTEGFGDERRPVYLFGAGHVGRALVLALAPLPFRVTWIDPRPDAFPAYVPANVTTVQAEDPAEVLAKASDGTFVLAVTHSHPLDLAVVAVGLASTRFPYVGVIGSKTKRARFTRQLTEAGIARARVAEMVCPIGALAIHSKLPAVIAATTVVELLERDEALKAGEMPMMGRA